ncbi:protein ACCELERATED CELL DEATH 6-like [Bidens hawaiensis]|uniref:protein ACCELERATED CELL DEATH 6-like n=1 Tax=Bidens hawaiensis TaxID=980011 RepID=UPI0040491632
MIYNKGVDRIVTQEFLDNLGNGLLGSDASKNSVLHLVSKIGNVACVKYILEKYPLMHSRNSDTETPTYVAAREGRVDILRYMIKLLRKENEDIESVLTRSIDDYNALHVAIQNHHVEVVFLLTKEIPQLANPNKSKESPLYLAAERGYIGVIELILKNCKKIAFNGPNGKTALHAAATSDSAECVECLLRTNPNLLNVKDDHGWTPLHHAIYHNSWLATTKLLNVDYSIGYHELIQENDTNTSAIHLAASLGHCETMKVLIDLCPGCSDFIDNKGRNILHVAVEYKKNKAIEFIFRDELLTNLINQKDINGNTPVHLLIIASDFEKMEMLMDSRVNMYARNKINLTPLDMISSYDQRKRLTKALTMVTHRVHDKKAALSSKEKQPEAKEKQSDDHFVIVDNLVVVAALTATASFAAAFTVPGGLESSDGVKKGTPFLLKEPAFQAFIITNAIAFSFSCCSLLCSIELLLYRNRYDELLLDEQEYVDGKVVNMYLLTTLALVAMTIAFIAGLYVVLTPAPGLAISVCVMTLLFRMIYHLTTYEATWELAQPVKKITC